MMELFALSVKSQNHNLGKESPVWYVVEPIKNLLAIAYRPSGNPLAPVTPAA